MSSSVEGIIDKFGRRRKSYRSKVVRVPQPKTIKDNHEGNSDVQNKRLTQVGAPQHESDTGNMKYVIESIQESGSSLHAAVSKSTDLIIATIQECVKKEIKQPVYEHIDKEIKVLECFIEVNGQTYARHIQETTDFILNAVYSRIDDEINLLRSAVDEKHAAIEKNMHTFINNLKNYVLLLKFQAHICSGQFPAFQFHFKYCARSMFSDSSSSDEEEALLLWSLEASKRKRKRKHWVHPINSKREEQGEFHTLFAELLEDEERFFIYFRMSISSFNELYSLIKHDIQKQDTNWRKAISAKERLAVFLR
ncbi:hypothetical protein NQ315_008840 [Exocentrus adspersus]|uniref:Uncharacterized protein n=1 Tax=Exocentrus adspersus TaxID=1586481 RepID=A0AAV8VCN5_9CUCU|nr:hypothetical protein NQ315_008840 [Exocentrus adspersus]